MQPMLESLKIPKSVYFEAVVLMESRSRLSAPPKRGKSRFVHNRHFLDALDYNRIMVRAAGGDESALDKWADLYDEKGEKDE